MKNYQDIVNHFDVIEKTITHSKEPILVIVGKKDNKIETLKVEYSYRPVMLAVQKKVNYFINIEK